MNKPIFNFTNPRNEQLFAVFYTDFDEGLKLTLFFQDSETISIDFNASESAAFVHKINNTWEQVAPSRQ